MRMWFGIELTSKATGQVVTLHEVDEAICQHLGCEVHPENWVMGWYDSIGTLIANRAERFLGSEKLRTEVSTWFAFDDMPGYEHGISQVTLNKILKFLEENYTSESYWSSFK